MNTMKRTLPIESPRIMEERVKSTLDDRDKKSIVRLLKDSGIASYEPRVVSLLVHRMRRYVSEVVTDARAYTDHAGRADISMKDVRLASRKRQDALTPGLLTREVGNDAVELAIPFGLAPVGNDAVKYAISFGLASVGNDAVKHATHMPSLKHMPTVPITTNQMVNLVLDALGHNHINSRGLIRTSLRMDVIQQAEEVNQIPLPTIPDEFGVRLPPPDQQNTLPNLKWEVDEMGAFSSETIPKNSEGAGRGRSHGGGNRNKKLKTLEKFKSRNPFALKEKTRQEEVSRVKAEAKARRRLQALNAKRSS